MLIYSILFHFTLYLLLYIFTTLCLLFSISIILSSFIKVLSILAVSPFFTCSRSCFAIITLRKHLLVYIIIHLVVNHHFLYTILLNTTSLLCGCFSTCSFLASAFVHSSVCQLSFCMFVLWCQKRC
jgi:hypothetical protein